MSLTNLQVKQFPKLYNYKGEFIAELSDALSITESLRFGSISTLEFDYPIYMVDVLNNVISDGDGNPLVNPKVAYLQNDMRCLFNSRWYVIKVDEDYRDDSNKLKIRCSCTEIACNLEELMVEYLTLTPPLANAVNATTAITMVLESAQQVRDNKIASAVSNTVTLDTNAHPTDSVYNGYKIKILFGTGLGQERTITAYNGTTKVATLSSAFSPLPDTTSVYRIYNDIWKVGTVDSVYNTDLRSHEFDFVNGLEALQQVRDKYFDANDEVGYLTYSSSFNSGTSKWENYVNLVSANAYDSVDFRYRKNIKSITRRKESNTIYTRLIPEGVDNLTIGSIGTSYRTDSSITYPDHISGHNYIDNFQYFLAQGYTYKQCLDNFIKTYRFADSRYTTATQLYNDGKKMLEKMSLPKYTYIVSALDLSKLTGREYESFGIGDTVKIVDEDLGIDIYAVISAMEVNQDTPQNASIELTNYVDNMSDIIKKIVNRGDGYSNLKSQYGNTATYIIADKLTSKNWRQADFVVQEFEDASTIIQKVIDGIDESIGAKIILLEGIYKCSQTIVLIKDNISIQGQGVSTVLQSNSTIQTLIRLPGYQSSNGIINNINLDNFKIEFTTTHEYPSFVIDCIYSENLICSNITIVSTAIYHIFIRSSINIKFINNTIMNENSLNKSYYGINLTDCAFTDIQNNNIIGWFVDSCIYYSPSSGGVYMGDLSIVGNNLKNYTKASYTIYVTGNEYNPDWENESMNYKTIIDSNIITMSTNSISEHYKGLGIAVNQCRNSTITNNKIYGGFIGIKITDSIYNTISNNIIDSYSFGTVGYITDLSCGILIYANTPIYAYSGRNNIQNNTLISLSNADNGIIISSNVDSCYITGNDVKYSCASPSTNGIYNLGTNTTITNNRIT